MNNYHHDITRISKSGLDAIADCPAVYHSRYLAGSSRQQTRGMQVGTAYHAIILEPAKYYAEIYPTLSHDMHSTVSAMKSATTAHPAARRLLTDGTAEVLHLWTDNTTQAQCKMMADYLPSQHDVIIDLKSMVDVSPSGFKRSCRKYRYDVQAAFYLDGLGATNPKSSFIFICCEAKPPHKTAVYLAPDSMINEGREKYLENLHTYMTCKASGQWPAYTNHKIQTIQW